MRSTHGAKHRCIKQPLRWGCLSLQWHFNQETHPVEYRLALKRFVGEASVLCVSISVLRVGYPLFVVADIHFSSCSSVIPQRRQCVSSFSPVLSCAHPSAPFKVGPLHLLQGVIDFGRGSRIELHFPSAPGESLCGLFWLRIKSGSFWFRFMGGESLPLPCLAEY